MRPSFLPINQLILLIEYAFNTLRKELNTDRYIGFTMNDGHPILSSLLNIIDAQSTFVYHC